MTLQVTWRQPCSFEAHLQIDIARQGRLAKKRSEVQMSDIPLRPITQRFGQHVDLALKRHRPLRFLTYWVQVDAGDDRLRRAFEVDSEAQLTMQDLPLQKA